MSYILPNAMLGILGGGQLGRMFTTAARTMGYRVTVLDPDPHSPAGSFADVHLCADYSDLSALDTLAATCSAVTTEFENVPADSLARLAECVRVSPFAEQVRVAQDRINEKNRIRNHGLPVAPFLPIRTENDITIQNSGNYLPGILKQARLGYDGKGQVQVTTLEEVLAAFFNLGQVSCVLEKKLALKTEISVIVARTTPSHTTAFPVAENWHRAGILDVSIVPARVSEAVAIRAQNMALSLAESMSYVGVLAVEFFVLENDELVINEIAPRPHNSGHYTLDACVTSQFDQQVRTLCGFPPGDTRLFTPVVMVNILGELWEKQEPCWEKLLSEPNVMLHLYGKQEARKGRKMGHFNVLAEEPEMALQQALSLREKLER